MSVFYNFLLNMWIMKKADEKYLQDRVTKGQITQEEYNSIISTNQIQTNEDNF